MALLMSGVPFRIFLLLFGVLIALRPATAAVRLDLAIGYGGLYRVGAWTPVYVTLTLPPANTPISRARLEAFAYQDARHTLLHTADIPLVPGTHTYLLPVRMGALIEAHSVLLRELTPAGPGRILAHARFGDLPAEEARLVVTPTRLVLTTGSPVGELVPGDFVGRFLPLPRLPDHPQLLESLDLLNLNAGDLEQLSPAQWEALRIWTLRGGRLLLCLPPEGLPEDLPVWAWAGVRQGPLEAFSPGITGRQIRPTAENTQPVPLTDGLTGSRRPFGLGQILVSPVRLSVDTRAAIAHLVGEVRPRVVTDWPTVGPMPSDALSRWLWGLLAAGFLLGPVDSALRRVRRVQPTWTARGTAVAGYLALAAAAVLWTSRPATDTPADSHTLIDQLGDQILAVTTQSTAPNLPTGHYPHPLPPPNFPGTSHALLVTRLVGSVPQADRWAPGFAAVTEVGPQDVNPWQVAPGHRQINLSRPATDAWLESGPGAVRWNAESPTTLQPTDTRPAQLPPTLAAARRLTPLRSGALQARITAGELRLLWLEEGHRITRLILTRPEDPPP